MRKLLAVTALVAGSLWPATAASAGPIVSVTLCPRDSVGVVVWHADYDTGQRELVSVCIPIEE